jgi:hypothetical protein
MVKSFDPLGRWLLQHLFDQIQEVLRSSRGCTFLFSSSFICIRPVDLSQHSVPPWIRAGYNKEFHRFSGSVHGLMRHIRRDLKPFMRMKLVLDSIQFEMQTTGQDEEKLLRLFVKMPDFLAVRGHFLMDNAALRPIHQPPTVAISAPHIMLCVLFTDHFISILSAIK